jgi:tetratricopeptide (TPR) repeat protein
MTTPPLPAPAPPDTAKLDELESLYETGRNLDAYRTAQSLAPLESWGSARALVLAGRLASQWGDGPLSNRLHLRARRLDPADESTAYYYVLAIWSKHGPLEALRVVRAITSRMPVEPATLFQAHLWLLEARALGAFRDFSAADPLFVRVERAYPHDPWLWVEKSCHLRDQDRYEESHAAACESIRLRPLYRPAIQAQANSLQLLNRDDEALSVLEAAWPKLQAGSIGQSLVLALEEKGRDADMLTTLDRVAELLPMADAADRRWIAARRCDAAYRLGDIETARKAAEANGQPYFKEIARRLSSVDLSLRRLQLPVGFVRQHHMTCAPATLAAISNYWGQPADHLEIAREICYDGSPDHAERTWAENHGWLVREFRATWDVTVALLERGCPFALVTVHIGNAHMQAVIGYDARLGTLLIRDPYQRNFSEMVASTFFENNTVHGPRALLLVPANRPELLEGIELPEAVIYDHWHSVRSALARHDRATAEQAALTLRHTAGDHLITLRAARELAEYDVNPARSLELVRSIRARFPDEVNWQVEELRLLDVLGHATEHRAKLREFGAPRSSYITFRRDYAEDLLRDAREQVRAYRILRSILRRQATEAKNLRALANLLWNRQEFLEATALYRLAACAADKVEYHWNSYFIASRHLGQTETSLALLRQRFERWGPHSSQPARTLFTSLNALERTADGFAVLDEALRLRPDDGELLLFVAEARGRFGEYAVAQNLLATAESRSTRAQWLRSAARLANYRQDHQAALAHWQELLILNPSDVDAHRAVANLLSTCEGQAKAVAQLAAACAAMPHLLPLRRLQIEWLRSGPTESALAALEQLLTEDASDAWALREKAIALTRLRQLDSALACAEEALRIAPHAPASHGVRARVLTALGRREEAHAGYVSSLRLSIDADWLYDDLISVCPDFAARRSAVDFLRDELLRQHSLDNAHLQFRSTARGILSPGELGETLRKFWQAHPENWATWSVLIAHLCDETKWDEALPLATDATKRFPLLPRAWLDLALVHRGRADAGEEIAALEKALAINPAWGNASRQLSANYERQHDLERAETVLRRAVTADPAEAINHGWLADILWRQRKSGEALAVIAHALELSPTYGWAWDKLAEWSRHTGDPDRAKRLALALTETRGGEASSWIRLVRLRVSDPCLDDNLAALDRALALEPRNVDIHDLRAELLVEHKRYDEAAACCRPEIFENAIPRELLGRAAWIEHKRGRVAEAITAMAAAVAIHPEYIWGWARLTDWHWEKKQFEQVGETARKWAWLATGSAIPHGYLATVHQHAGRKLEAKKAFARSIEIDPVYQFGVFELLKMYLADREFEAADRLLKHVETHFSTAESLRAQIRYHLARSDRPAACLALRQLARQPSPLDEPLDRTAELFFTAGWDAEVEEALTPLLAEEGTPPSLGELWIRARKKRPVWGTLWRLRSIRTTAAHRRKIDSALVSWLGEAKHRWFLRWVTWRRRKPLRADPDGWGEVGYAFNTSGLFRQAVRWMRDWNQRPEPPAPWMMLNLIQSHYSIKQPAAALVALDFSLRLPADQTREKLLVWRACEHALAGETPASDEILASIHPEEKPKYYLAILTFTRCLLEVQKAPVDERAGAVRSAEQKLRQQVAEFPEILTGAALSQFHRRTLRRLGVDGQRPWLRVRSHLPMMAPSKLARGKSEANPFVIIFFILLLSSLLRTCIGTP